MIGARRSVLISAAVNAAVFTATWAPAATAGIQTKGIKSVS